MQTVSANLRKKLDGVKDIEIRILAVSAWHPETVCLQPTAAKYIRQLKVLNIAVFFEKENINTMDSKGEVLLIIMASLAQQESESLSQNVKMGIQFRYQQGIVQVNHNQFLGYTKDADKSLVIVPEEVEIIKRIYRAYLEGANYKEISAGLEADVILTAAGNPRWHASTLRQAEREIPMKMEDWAKHLDGILTSTGERVFTVSRSLGNEKIREKATNCS